MTSHVHLTRRTYGQALSRETLHSERKRVHIVLVISRGIDARYAVWELRKPRCFLEPEAYISDPRPYG